MRFWHPDSSSHHLAAGFPRAIILSVAILSVPACPRGAAAQTAIEGFRPGMPVRLIQEDEAVLNAREPRNDLPCRVNRLNAVLGFDMRFHAGYEAIVPLGELTAAAGADLRIVFRVTPEAGEVVHFSQRFPVPEFPAERRGEVTVQGTFDLGEGRYRIDWLMRDGSERVCAAFWEVTAVRAPKDRPVILSLSPGVAKSSDRELFRAETTAPNVGTTSALHLKILVNCAPLNPRSVILQPADVDALVSGLRAIIRQPAVQHVAILAFSLQEMRILYHQNEIGRVDFVALGDALRALNPGTVHISAIGRQHPEADFLADLIREALQNDDRPDALVFLGPRAPLHEDVPREAFDQAGPVHVPVFYISYNVYRESTIWKDVIGRAVDAFKGHEYPVVQPRDLWYAATDMVSRAKAAKAGRAP